MSKENIGESKPETTDKKSLIKKIIKIALTLILIVIFIVIGILPFLCFIGIVLYSMFIDIPAKPNIKHGEFQFELVYEYKGEQYTIKDTIVCDYNGYSWSLDGGNPRDSTCELSKDNEYGQYIIDRINEQYHYIEETEEAVSTIKIVKETETTLELDFDGEVRTFEKEM